MKYSNHLKQLKHLFWINCAEITLNILHSEAFRPQDKMNRIIFLKGIFLKFLVVLSPFCPVLAHELLEKFDELDLIQNPNPLQSLQPIKVENEEIARKNAHLVSEF